MSTYKHRIIYCLPNSKQQLPKELYINIRIHRAVVECPFFFIQISPTYTTTKNRLQWSCNVYTCLYKKHKNYCILLEQLRVWVDSRPCSLLGVACKTNDIYAKYMVFKCTRIVSLLNKQSQGKGGKFKIIHHTPSITYTAYRPQIYTLIGFMCLCVQKKYYSYTPQTFRSIRCI